MTRPDDDAPQPPRRKRMTTHPPRVSTTTPGVIVRMPGESGPIRKQIDDAPALPSDGDPPT